MLNNTNKSSSRFLKSDFKVGDLVYYTVSDYYETKVYSEVEGVVTKVGRKYVTITTLDGSGEELRFPLSTGVITWLYSTTKKLYKSTEDII